MHRAFSYSAVAANERNEGEVLEKKGLPSTACERTFTFSLASEVVFMWGGVSLPRTICIKTTSEGGMDELIVEFEGVGERR